MNSSPGNLVRAAALALLTTLVPVVAGAQERPQSLGQLLDFVREGQATDAGEQRQREERFLQDRATQQAELERAKSLRAAAQRRSQELEKRFDANEQRIAHKQEQLRDRLGALGEMLGHLGAAAVDARAVFHGSLTAAQYGDERVARLDELARRAGSGDELPGIADLEGLWYELQREMVASGTVEEFAATVSLPDGAREQVDVVRVGAFNVVAASGDYLAYQPGSGVLSMLARQPGGWLVDDAADLAAASAGFHPFGIDPTGPSGGGYLGALVASPSLAERIRQGGLIGYVTMALGVLGAALAAWRLAALHAMLSRVEEQLRNPEAGTDNPLGRVLAAHRANPQMDVETLQLRLDEAVLKEIPPIQSGLALLKIIAAVAPLLGLLGTVTGMIATFQAITIFGAGDPKAMAAGISQALVTTVQGLCVAIPVVLLHTLVSSRANRIVQILEEQVAGVIAEHTEFSRGAH